MFVRELFGSVLRLPQKFAGVAMHDPISAFLLAVGAVLTLLSVGYFGLLVVGAVADALTPSAG